MLLELAVTMDRNWQKISEQFSSFKNRKGCLTRYKILNRRLEDEKFENSLEAVSYHLLSLCKLNRSVLSYIFYVLLI